LADVTVYTRTPCVQCNATKRHLDRIGVDYDVIDVTNSAEDAQYLTDQGFMQAPVVEVRDGDGVVVDSWSGFVPDKLDTLA